MKVNDKTIDKYLHFLLTGVLWFKLVSVCILAIMDIFNLI